MAQNLGIGVSVYLRDLFSAPAARVNTSMRNLHRNALRMNSATLRSIQAQNMAIAGMGALALRGMGQAVRVGAEFGDTMTYVESITGKTTGSMDALKKKALDLGKTTMFTARDIASGMQFMAMTGQGRSTIQEQISAATDLAGATMSRLGGRGGAADILTNIMKMFKIGPESSRRTADILTTITSSANVQLTELGDAIAYSGDTMTGLNIGLTETAAMIGIMGDAGIKGTMGGTALGNMFRFLTKAAGEFRTTRQSKAMELLGLNVGDFITAKGELKEVGTILKNLKKAADAQTTVGAQSMMEAIFNIRGKRASTQLIDRLDRYEELVAKIKSGEMTAGEIMNKRMNSLQGNILKMTSAWEVLKVQFTETIKPIIVPALKVVTAIISGITNFLQIPILGNFFGRWALGFVLIKTAAAALRVIISTFALIYKGAAAAFTSRVATTVAGYNAMTAASNRYTASTMGGAMGGGMMPPGALASAYYRRGHTGALGRTKGGTFYKTMRGGGKRFVSHRVADRYYQMHGASMMARGSKFGRFMGMGGRTVGRGLLGRLGLGVLGRLAGVLTGPIGMAVMIGIPLISSLISAVKGNTDATEENTENIKPSGPSAGNRLHSYMIKGKGITDKMGYSGDSFHASYDEFMKVNRLLMPAEAAGVRAKAKKDAINIYVDGVKTIVEQETENQLRAQLQYNIL